MQEIWPEIERAAWIKNDRPGYNHPGGGIGTAPGSFQDGGHLYR